MFLTQWSMWVTGRSGRGGTLWSTNGMCGAPSGRSVSSGVIWPVTGGSGGPLLIVVWNEEVEAVFHELGRAAGLHDADGDDGPVEAVRACREFRMLVDVRPEGLRGQLGRWRVRGLISAIRGAVWGFGRARVPCRLA